jgi:hypothetical protein
MLIILGIVLFLGFAGIMGIIFLPTILWGMRHHKKEAYKILSGGERNKLDATIKFLSSLQDEESRELVRKLMRLKEGGYEMQQWYQCPRCGAQVAFGVRFCGNCQTPLNWPTQQQPQPPQQQYQQPQYQQPYQQTPQYQQQPLQYQQPEPPKKKSKLGLILLGVILFALAAVGSCVVCVMQPGSSDVTSPETPSSTSPPATQTPPATFTPIVKSGTDSLTTTPFTITTDEWIIDWSYSTSDPDLAIFGFFIYPRGETEVYTEAVLFPEATSGSTYSYAGPGEYYIKTNVANIDGWEITIRPAN